MNNNRQPQGTSVGGQFAPGGASEVDDPSFDDFGEPTFSDYATYDDEGCLRHPDADSLVPSLQAEAEDHPDTRCDFDPERPDSATYDDFLDRHTLGQSSYADSYQKARETYPDVGEVEFAERFDRINFASARMLHHVDSGEDAVIDDIDRDISGGSEDQNEVIRAWAQTTSREIARLREREDESIGG